MTRPLSRRRFLALSGLAFAGAASARLAPSTSAATATNSGYWLAAASLATARRAHTATLLDDRRVLVVGGLGAANPGADASEASLPDAEAYEPFANRWQAAPRPLDRRAFHTATILRDGRVLVAGGARERGESLAALDTAEVYDPLRDRWTGTAPLAFPRAFHTATLLDDGRVLVAGGGPFGEPPLLGAEVYDPATNRWAAAGRLIVPRAGHSATLQPSGRVLLIGGAGRASAIADAEVYIPEENRWVAIAPMRGRRFGHTATLLYDRRTLVVGGAEEASVGNTLSTVEVQRTGGAGWASVAALRSGRTGHSAVTLLDGRVLLVGGRETYTSHRRDTELFNPDTSRFDAVAPLGIGRVGHTATSLDDYSVLLVGGRDENGVLLREVERYDPPQPSR